MAVRVFGPMWLALAAPLASCGSSTSPSDSFDLVVAGSESGRVIYLNRQSGAVVGVAPFTLGPILSFALDSSRTLAYLTAVDPGGRELLAIDLRSRSVRWRLPMTDGTHAVSYDGVQISGQKIGLFVDNRTLAMGNSLRNQTLRIAAFNPIARTVREFRGPPDALGITSLPVSGSLAESVLTDRQPDGRVGIKILVLAPNSLQPLDSIAPDPPFEDPGQLVEPPDGDRVYITNHTSIYAWSRGRSPPHYVDS